MCRWNGFLVGVAVALMAAAQVNAVPVTMSSYAYTGQTRVFRGDLSGLGLGTVTGATVTDAGMFGGQDGVFSGFDLDFLLLDLDGNLSTTGDQILPLQAGTTVSAGSIRNQAGSSYQLTTLHPGALFGLNADGSIDFTTATIASLDGLYVASPLAVDSSSGWVTLGDNGSLFGAFPQTAIGQSLYLFVGEVGDPVYGSVEGLNATVDVTSQPVIPVPGAILLAGLGTVLLGTLRRRRVL